MRGKGEGAVYKRKSDGLWCISIELPPGPGGKRRRKVIARKDKAAVIQEMRAHQLKLNELGNLPTSGLTVKAWLTKWIDDIAPNEIRPKSYEAYKSTVNTWLIPNLGTKRLDTLSTDHVRHLFDVILSTPKSLKLREPGAIVPDDAPRVGVDTAKKAHAVLSSALKAAKREGKALRNVCEFVDPPKKIGKLQRALTLEEAMSLLAHLGTAKTRQEKENAAMWAMFLLTGWRRGEVIGLESDRVTEEQLDLSWQLIRITDIDKAADDYEYRHVRVNLYLTRPKSTSGWRITPLVDPLASIMRMHMKGRGDGLVFLNNGVAWDPDSVTAAWEKLLAAAGLPDDVVLHGARHTVVDLLDAAGVDWETIKDITGHATTLQSKQYRTRVDVNRLKLALESMSRLLEVGA